MPSIWVTSFSVSPPALVDVTDHLKIDSCSISGGLYGQWKLSAVLQDLDGTLTPQKCAEVRVYDDDSPPSLRFAGMISQVKKTQEMTADVSKAIFHYNIEARDYNSVLAHRLCPGTVVYAAGTSVYDVLAHIIENFLNGEGITLGTVDSPAPVLSSDLAFDYASVSEMIAKLGAATECLGYVDFNKRLNFSEFVSNPAPFAITDVSGEWRNMEYTNSDDNYRNRQYERAEITLATASGASVSDPPVTAVPGQWQFGLSSIVQDVISVTVDGIPETFAGITHAERDAAITAGAPPGPEKWYWVTDMGCSELDRIGNPFTGGEVVQFTYLPRLNLFGQPTGPQVIVVNDLAEQATRKALSGGSGIWENIEDQKSVTSIAVLQDIAQGRINQGKYGDVLNFETLRSGLMPAQRLTVNLAAWGIDDEYLIQSVIYKWVAAISDFWTTSVKAGKTFGFGSSAAWLARLVEMARLGMPISTARGSGMGMAGLPDGYVPPDVSSWSWINDAGSGIILDTASGYPYFRYPSRASDDWVLKVKPILGDVFTINVVIRETMLSVIGSCAGLCLYDSHTGKMIFFGSFSGGGYWNAVQVAYYHAINAPANWGNGIGTNIFVSGALVYLRIVQTATQLTCSISVDGGEHYSTIFDGVRTYMGVTPTHYGVCLLAANTYVWTDLAILDWKEN